MNDLDRTLRKFLAFNIFEVIYWEGYHGEINTIAKLFPYKIYPTLLISCDMLLNYTYYIQFNELINAKERVRFFKICPYNAFDRIKVCQLVNLILNDQSVNIDNYDKCFDLAITRISTNNYSAKLYPSLNLYDIPDNSEINNNEKLIKQKSRAQADSFFSEYEARRFNPPKPL